MKRFAKNIVAKRSFEYFIIALIVLNGIVLGLETSSTLMENYGVWFNLVNNIIIGFFVLEATLKIIAVAPRLKLYFGDGWNLFDFTVVVLSILPTTGEFATIARLARLLRVARLISTIPELRLIVSTLIRSIPSMGHVILLMSIIFYIYGIAGFHLFHEHDPQHWRSLPISLLTLFRIVTLEDWTDVMYTAMEMNPWTWTYFVSFVVLGTFVVINLFIAVVLNNLEEAKQERLEELRKPAGKNEIIKELKETQAALARLQLKLETNDKF